MDEIIQRLEAFNADFTRAFATGAPRTENELRELGAIVTLLRAVEHSIAGSLVSTGG
jgi:hypothetical protein